MVSGNKSVSESVHFKHEAWRNLVLILCAITVSYSFESFTKIKKALISLTDFDRTINPQAWPALLSILIIIYIAKHSHGIIITLYDKHYVELIEENVSYIGMSFGITTLLVTSFAMVSQLSLWIMDSDTLESRCGRIMFAYLFPNMILLLFDIFHMRAFEYSYGKGPLNILRDICMEVKRLPKSRVSHKEYKLMWLLENIVTVIILIMWVVLNNAVIKINSTKIIYTIITLGFLLIWNSIVDYFLNCQYFFGYFITTKTKKK